MYASVRNWQCWFVGDSIVSSNARRAYRRWWWQLIHVVLIRLYSINWIINLTGLLVVVVRCAYACLCIWGRILKIFTCSQFACEIAICRVHISSFRNANILKHSIHTLLVCNSLFYRWFEISDSSGVGISKNHFIHPDTKLYPIYSAQRTFLTHSCS